MKLLSVILTFLATASAFAVDGHESGGRIAASTVYLRFTSKGAGINSVAAQGAQTLIQQFTNSKDVAETNRKPWGREGELDLCVRFNSPNARLRFTEAFDRVLRASQKASDGDVSMQVNASSCQVWPATMSKSTGIFIPQGIYGADKATLSCHAKSDEPEGYHVNVNFFETLDGDKTLIRFGVYQSSTLGRYRPILGQVSRFATMLHRHDVSLEYEGTNFNVYVYPTTKVDPSYHALYEGTVKIGTTELPVTCTSGRIYTP
jgi:hypothetical protein